MAESYDQFLNGLKQQDPNKPSNIVADLRKKLFNPPPRPINPPVGYAGGSAYVAGGPLDPTSDLSLRAQSPENALLGTFGLRPSVTQGIVSEDDDVMLENMARGQPAVRPVAMSLAAPGQGLGMQRAQPTAAPAPGAQEAPQMSEYGRMMHALSGMTIAQAVQLFGSADAQKRESPRDQALSAMLSIAQDRRDRNVAAGLSSDKVLEAAMRDFAAALSPGQAASAAATPNTIE